MPNLIGQFVDTIPGAKTAWEDSAGFTGELDDKTNGQEIVSQSLVPLAVIDCASTMRVSKNGNQAYP